MSWLKAIGFIYRTKVELENKCNVCNFLKRRTPLLSNTTNIVLLLLFQTGSELLANGRWLIYLHTFPKELLCVFHNWRGAESFSATKTHLFAFSWQPVTNNSPLRMITVSEIVRICQMSNYLLDINWPWADMQNLMITKGQIIMSP